jgi:CubicO group peptidase (beta-lactamase class C family)
MRLAMIALAAAGLLSTAARAEELAGEWHGELTAGPTPVKVALSVTKAPGGGYQARSRAVGPVLGEWRPVDVLVADGDRILIAAPFSAALYDGRWDAAAKQWSGTWVQGPGAAPFTLSRGAAPVTLAPRVEGLDGRWSGVLAIPGGTQKLTLVFNVRTNEDGTRVTADSPDQGAYNMPGASATRDGQKVTFEVASVRGKLEAMLDASGQSMTGTFSQGVALPITLTRADLPPAPEPALPPRRTAKGPLTDAEIATDLARRIDVEKRGVAIVVGIVDRQGRRRIVAHGGLAKGDGPRADGRTVFEIGSISKTFTGLLLADMVRRGEVALDDPVQKYLPDTVKIPQRNGKQITLFDLTTHTSGLPRMPTNFTPKDPKNPYADYTVEQMYAFLSGYQLTRDIGERSEYSNLGAGLLGHALARRAGVDYETLLRERITGPLGMTDTAIAFTPEMKAHLAIGHNAALAPTANWDIPTMAGAGAIRSTVEDMLDYVSLGLGKGPKDLQADVAAQTAKRRGAAVPGLEIGYGWHISTRRGQEIVWHNGGTGGYLTFAGFDRKQGLGVVVLTNVSMPPGSDDIGFHIFDPDLPMSAKAP